MQCYSADYLMRITAFISIACILFLGCDRGLAPPPPALTKPVISGTIRFAGAKPPCDSVRTLAVVISQNPAPFSVSDIITQFGIKIFGYIIEPCSFKDTTYSFTLAPGTYSYLGVAQRYDTSLYNDWRIIGFAHDEQDSAQNFTLKYGDNIKGVDIRVRFDSSSRQPFIK
jgi:hypothetical protein